MPGGRPSTCSVPIASVSVQNQKDTIRRSATAGKKLSDANGSSMIRITTAPAPASGSISLGGSSSGVSFKSRGSMFGAAQVATPKNHLGIGALGAGTLTSPKGRMSLMCARNSIRRTSVMQEDVTKAVVAFQRGKFEEKSGDECSDSDSESNSSNSEGASSKDDSEGKESFPCGPSATRARVSLAVEKHEVQVKEYVVDEVTDFDRKQQQFVKLRKQELALRDQARMCGLPSYGVYGVMNKIFKKRRLSDPVEVVRKQELQRILEATKQRPNRSSIKRSTLAEWPKRRYTIDRARASQFRTSRGSIAAAFTGPRGTSTRGSSIGTFVSRRSIEAATRDLFTLVPNDSLELLRIRRTNEIAIRKADRRGGGRGDVARASLLITGIFYDKLFFNHIFDSSKFRRRFLKPLTEQFFKNIVLQMGRKRHCSFACH